MARVLITGFEEYDVGFDKVDVNASKECVQLLIKEDIQNKFDVDLHVRYLPVDYNKVHTKITELWQDQHFDLVIHVGLNKEVECLRLESQACKQHYFIGDCEGQCPVDYEHPLGEDSVMNTALDVEAILNKYNADPPDQLTAEVSDNAGKFLCEYLYYASLYHSQTKKVLFVHVPHERYSYEQLARGLERLLELALDHCKE